MTESDIQSLSDEDLAFLMFAERLSNPGSILFIHLEAETFNRSEHAASQRAARGERALPLDPV